MVRRLVRRGGEVAEHVTGVDGGRLLERIVLGRRLLVFVVARLRESSVVTEEEQKERVHDVIGHECCDGAGLPYSTSAMAEGNQRGVTDVAYYMGCCINEALNCNHQCLIAADFIALAVNGLPLRVI